ncbi:hypothetical protein [Streptococcus uberis]|uniref:hypothetical protein n=1 Tax=Streptococcus uberis TaxID=1349 RepID=UPI0012B5B7CF|nr:hypothetical protein [Streptococcus uberis]MTB54037.1 hypothetical protein [Streptococcus uberis]MTB60122.1 hypothetical protein [Streptococcus uberis]
MAKTIKEIADELGYSKTYISKIIKTNGLQTSLRKIGNKFVVGDELEMLIKEHLKNSSQTNNANKTKTQTDNTNNKPKTVFENTNNADIPGNNNDVENKNKLQQKDDVTKEMFDFLREQIRQKDLQISQKDEQLVELNERLKETIIMLNDTRKELSSSYGLIETNQEVKNTDDIQVDNVKEDTEKHKWYQFWKR